MAYTLPVVLMYKMRLYKRVIGVYIILYLIAQVTNYKNKFVNPAFFNWSIIMLKTVLPASGINALGCVYVCGRSFVPAPATGIIAFIQYYFDGLQLHKPSHAILNNNLSIFAKRTNLHFFRKAEILL